MHKIYAVAAAVSRGRQYRKQQTGWGVPERRGHPHCLQCPLHGECLREPYHCSFRRICKHGRRTAGRVEGQLHSSGQAADGRPAFPKSSRAPTKGIGRYDFGSAGSRSGFFMSGVMCADFKVFGTTPWSNDLLKSSVKKGARMSTYFFSRLVGIAGLMHTAYQVIGELRHSK